MNSFEIVREFERKVASFAGSKYAVAVNTGTSAIFLSLMYCKETLGKEDIWLPARTFVSVPMAVRHAGLSVSFEDYEWEGVYKLDPYPVYDGALRFRRNMYQGGLHCLSFHARKLLNIGEGGMVLTDDESAYKWLRKASYSGREEPDYKVEDIDMLGWQYYMNPEKAARGIQLLEFAEDWQDQKMTYPDLRKVPAFG